MFLCTCVHACELSCSVMSNSLHLDGLQPARLLSPWRFSRQEYWRELPCPPPGDLPNPRIKPRSLSLEADSLPAELVEAPLCTQLLFIKFLIIPAKIYFFFTWIWYTKIIFALCILFCLPEELYFMLDLSAKYQKKKSVSNSFCLIVEITNCWQVINCGYKCILKISKIFLFQDSGKSMCLEDFHQLLLTISCFFLCKSEKSLHLGSWWQKYNIEKFTRLMSRIDS